MPERKDFEIIWPNIIRIDHEYRPQLTLDLSKIKPLTLDAYDTPTDRRPRAGHRRQTGRHQTDQHRRRKTRREQRMQRVIFQSAAEVYDLMKPDWKANREFLLAQIIRLTEDYLTSGRIVISPQLFNQDEVRRRILFTLNMTKIVQHLWEAIRFENALTLCPNSTRNARSVLPAICSHGLPAGLVNLPCAPISTCVLDSRWEGSEAFELDRNSNVRVGKE